MHDHRGGHAGCLQRAVGAPSCRLQGAVGAGFISCNYASRQQSSRPEGALPQLNVPLLTPPTRSPEKAAQASGPVHCKASGPDAAPTRPTRVTSPRPLLQVLALTVKRSEVDVETPTGKMRTTIIQPTAPGRYPGIVFYSEIFQALTRPPNPHPLIRRPHAALPPPPPRRARRRLRPFRPRR